MSGLEMCMQGQSRLPDMQRGAIVLSDSRRAFGPLLTEVYM